jgi:DNA-binding NtrC family response regulator
MDMGDTDTQNFLEAISTITYCNPFVPERIEWEQKALGSAFVPEPDTTWSRVPGMGDQDRPNVVQLTDRANRLAEQLRPAYRATKISRDKLDGLYQDLVTYVLHYRHFAGTVTEFDRSDPSTLRLRWKRFLDDYLHYLGEDSPANETGGGPEHLFALLDQVRRAFSYVFDLIVGDSTPAAKLRAAVWQSIFTHDMRRYRRSLYRHMADVSTLITGPSGSGKDLVAQAIGQSQYVPFDRKSVTFADRGETRFVPLNLSAFSPQLIESELFGHSKGAFTGANSDRPGWLEQSPSSGGLFLDEIGELDSAIQVKLLRVIQTRAYSRLGANDMRHFQGKLLAATNRDLSTEIEAGRFRMDLFYRLCADHVETPSLRAQLDDRPQALDRLILTLAQRIAGDEAPAVAAETQTWIHQSLPTDYPWPGNIRELEQCLRNVMVRRSYLPPVASQFANNTPAWLMNLSNRELTADELVRRYVTWVYAHERTYERTAEIVQLDRRTVKAKVDQVWLATINPN